MTGPVVRDHADRILAGKCLGGGRRRRPPCRGRSLPVQVAAAEEACSQPANRRRNIVDVPMVSECEDALSQLSGQTAADGSTRVFDSSKFSPVAAPVSRLTLGAAAVAVMYRVHIGSRFASRTLLGYELGREHRPADSHRRPGRRSAWRNSDAQYTRTCDRLSHCRASRYLTRWWPRGTF